MPDAERPELAPPAAALPPTLPNVALSGVALPAAALPNVALLAGLPDVEVSPVELPEADPAAGAPEVGLWLDVWLPVAELAEPKTVGTLARAALALGTAEIGREEPSTRSGVRPDPLTGRAEPLARPDEPGAGTEAEPDPEPDGEAEPAPGRVVEPADGTETDAEPLTEPAGRTRAEPLAPPGGAGLTEAVPRPAAEPLADGVPLPGVEDPAEAERPDAEAPLEELPAAEGPPESELLPEGESSADADAPGTVARPLAPLVGALLGVALSSDEEAGVAHSAPGAGGGGGA